MRKICSLGISEDIGAARAIGMIIKARAYGTLDGRPQD
jgi:hypothetical protein